MLQSVKIISEPYGDW